MNIATIGGLAASVMLIAIGQVAVPVDSNLGALSSLSGAALMFLVVVLFATRVIPAILKTNAEGHKAHAESNKAVATAISDAAKSQQASLDKLSDTQREVIKHCATVNARKEG